MNVVIKQPGHLSINPPNINYDLPGMGHNHPERQKQESADYKKQSGGVATKVTTTRGIFESYHITQQFTKLSLFLSNLLLLPYLSEPLYTQTCLSVIK